MAETADSPTEREPWNPLVTSSTEKIRCSPRQNSGKYPSGATQRKSTRSCSLTSQKRIFPIGNSRRIIWLNNLRREPRPFCQPCLWRRTKLESAVVLEYAWIPNTWHPARVFDSHVDRIQRDYPCKHAFLLFCERFLNISLL